MLPFVRDGRGALGLLAQEALGQCCVATLFCALGCGADSRELPRSVAPTPPPIAAETPSSEGTPPTIEEPPPAAPRTEPIRVTLVLGRGVTQAAEDSARAALGDDPRVVLSAVAHPDVGNGALDQAEVVLFTGGRGSIQGEALGELGRQRVREFVEHGGGYVGICAGAYLAIQGPAEFFKVGIVAAANATGDYWQRGSRDLPLRFEAANGLTDEPSIDLHYENGPIFAERTVEGLPAYRTLAWFAAEIAMPEQGTHPGEMIDRPAIIESSYGAGRVLLFSPNPVLGEVPQPELLLRAIDRVAPR